MVLTDYGIDNIDKCPDPDDKFVVYWSKLEPLLQSCITCGNRSTTEKSWVRGSMSKLLAISDIHMSGLRSLTLEIWRHSKQLYIADREFIHTCK